MIYSLVRGRDKSLQLMREAGLLQLSVPPAKCISHLISFFFKTPKASYNYTYVPFLIAGVFAEFFIFIMKGEQLKCHEMIGLPLSLIDHVLQKKKKSTFSNK